jgi:hypothetical protein
MRILLQPTINNIGTGDLQSLYDTAITDASEIFIVSAYLTEWRPKQRISPNCQRLSFIVGTDFGITRKNACRDVLRWLPQRFQGDFLAADHVGGFHPKFVMWKDIAGNRKIVLGSSNLTQAAFTKNFEANIFTSLSPEEYDTIRTWVYGIKLGCSPISEDWLTHYRESIQQSKGRAAKNPTVVALLVPRGADISRAILDRRKQHKAFQTISDHLAELIRKCASGQIANDEFYEKMMETWGKHVSRLQGRGFEIRGKHSDWQDVCKSIAAILDAGPSSEPDALDDLVRKEINRLAKNHNPNRGAWMSEMLCHYLPDRYPVVNTPVKSWLSHIKYGPPHKASEGGRYIDLARKLRLAINQRKNNARNLLELDHGIWKWYDKKRKKLLPKGMP